MLTKFCKSASFGDCHLFKKERIIFVDNEIITADGLDDFTAVKQVVKTFALYMTCRKWGGVLSTYWLNDFSIFFSIYII